MNEPQQFCVKQEARVFVQRDEFRSENVNFCCVLDLKCTQDVKVRLKVMVKHEEEITTFHCIFAMFESSGSVLERKSESYLDFYFWTFNPSIFLEVYPI